jgi:merozoite surface protein 4
MRQPLRALAVATASLSLAGGAIAAATVVSANPAPQVVIPVSATSTHDSAGHDANDDHGGNRASSSPGSSPQTASSQPGADDPATHDANDDNSPRVTPNATESHRHGADDPAGHDAGDDHGGSNSGRH